MYTVAELIETLKQCPQDYKVDFFSHYEGLGFDIDEVAINHEAETVTLYD